MAGKDVLSAKTPESFKDHYYPLLMEQYKLYVNMADKVSGRRDNINKLFLGIMTILLGGVGVSLNSGKATPFPLVVSVMGMLFCYIWHQIINSYRQLNSGKYRIVHQIEDKLPVKPYDAEWEALGKGKDPELYVPISHVEERIPILFGVAYAVIAVISIILLVLSVRV
ncbi:MAG: hypothetical protein M0Z41_08920 [Peptococcaceae bacterium]|jgi:hypothetical protein|nr:hypothetical protein [Peptococcaceae bacterium]